MWVHARYLLDRSIGSFGRVILLLFRLDFETVFEGGEFVFGLELSRGDTLLEVFGDVVFGNVEESGVFGVVIFLRGLFGRFGGVVCGASVGDVCSFGGPRGEWLVIRGGGLGDVGLEAPLDKLDVGIDPRLNTGVFVKDLLVD